MILFGMLFVLLMPEEQNRMQSKINQVQIQIFTRIKVIFGETSTNRPIGLLRFKNEKGEGVNRLVMWHCVLLCHGTVTVTPDLCST